MTALYREPGLAVSARSIGETFLCDECGLPGAKASPGQKRHTGACQRKHAATMAAGRLKGTGIEVRRRRRKG